VSRSCSARAAEGRPRRAALLTGDRLDGLLLLFDFVAREYGVDLCRADEVAELRTIETWPAPSCAAVSGRGARPACPDHRTTGPSGPPTVGPALAGAQQPQPRKLAAVLALERLRGRRVRQLPLQDLRSTGWPGGVEARGRERSTSSASAYPLSATGSAGSRGRARSLRRLVAVQAGWPVASTRSGPKLRVLGPRGRVRTSTSCPLSSSASLSSWRRRVVLDDEHPLGRARPGPALPRGAGGACRGAAPPRRAAGASARSAPPCRAALCARTLPPCSCAIP
jgi:hypothetical protein